MLSHRPRRRNLHADAGRAKQGSSLRTHATPARDDQWYGDRRGATLVLRARRDTGGSTSRGGFGHNLALGLAQKVGLARSADIECALRQTNVGAGAADCMPGGPYELVVRPQDPNDARDILRERTDAADR
jgi:hypothetical protein